MAGISPALLVFCC